MRSISLSNLHIFCEIDSRAGGFCRLPDFVTKSDFDWAVAEATRKKKTDFSKVAFFHYEEGR